MKFLKKKDDGFLYAYNELLVTYNADKFEIVTIEDPDKKSDELKKESIAEKIKTKKN